MSRLIDVDKLREEVLKWMPPDPCGQEEKEHPFETDIVVSMMMTIEEAETVEAIPVPWIEAEIKKLRDMDNGFASLSAGQIEAMLKKWREEKKVRLHDTGTDNRN